MHLELEPPVGKNFIQNVKPGIITINNISYISNLILTRDFLAPWDVDCFEKISQPDLEVMLEHKPELIIIGTGITPKFLGPALLLFIQKQGIGIESMTTDAACRTFNVLLSEGRRVLAALMV